MYRNGIVSATVTATAKTLAHISISHYIDSVGDILFCSFLRLLLFSMKPERTAVKSCTNVSGGDLVKLVTVATIIIVMRYAFHFFLCGQ